MVCTQSYGTLKLWESQFREFQNSHLGVPGQNDIWMLVPWLGTGGRWWLPPNLGRDESYESMFARGSSMHQKGSSYALTHLLFGLCRFMWVIELLDNLPGSHLGAPACLFIVEMLQAKNHAPTFSPSIIFTFRFVVSPSRSLGDALGEAIWWVVLRKKS